MDNKEKKYNVTLQYMYISRSGKVFKGMPLDERSVKTLVAALEASEEGQRIIFRELHPEARQRIADKRGKNLEQVPTHVLELEVKREREESPV